MPEHRPEVIVPAVLGGGGQVGDEAYAVGHPLGYVDSLTSGVISGLDRSIEVDGRQDAARPDPVRRGRQPGNSGGPLLNRSGQVIGIVTALANPSRDGYFIGIGFAVPIGTAGGAANAPAKMTTRRGSHESPQPTLDASLEQVLYEVKSVIVGQDALLERMVVALLARGHLLVEGVPGLAKTMAVKTLAQAIGGEFQRIQFTPDLVPADIVGTRVFNQKLGEFQVSLGPGVREPRARRRDQPRAGEGAERAARSDAGATGHDRPRDASRSPIPSS